MRTAESAALSARLAVQRYEWLGEALSSGGAKNSANIQARVRENVNLDRTACILIIVGYIIELITESERNTRGAYCERHVN